MAILTKAQLQAANSSSFPNNNSQAITPQILRDYNSSVIDTLVDSLDTGSFARTDITNDFTQTNNFTSISASAFVSASNFIGDGSKLTNITASTALPILDEGVLQGYATSMNFTGSAISAQVIAGTAVVQVNIDNVGLVTTASFNAYTQSTNTSINNLNASSASQQVSINALNQSSASQQVSINALNVYTASQDSSSIVNSITELNSWSASAKIELTNLNTGVTNLNSFSSSANSSISQLNASSASQQVSINALNVSSASLNTFSASAQTSINSINAVSSSWITESETGSFVTTNTIQTITAAKQFNANIAMSTTTPIIFGGFATTTISGNGFRGININATENDGDNAITIKTGAGNSQPNNTITLITDGSSVTNKITLQSANIIITGSADISGNLTASLQQGYVWVGNASGVSTTVATSSFATNVSGFVTTASFNSYTQSNDQRVSSLEVNSASVNTSITNINSTTASLNTSVSALNTFTASQSTASLVTSITELNTFSASALISISNLNSATASLFGSASLALTTASFDNGTRNLTFTKGDNQTFSVNIPDVSGSAGTFVTTSSFNAYTQSNDQRVSSLEANSASVNTSIANINTTTASLNTSVSALNTFTASQSTASLVTSIDNLNTFSASALVSISNLNTTTQSLNTSVTNLNSATASLFTSASLSLTTASVNLNTITFTKGDGTTFPITVNTGSGGGGTTNTGSLLVTASAFINTITFTKGDGTTFPVTVTTGSLNYVTGSFGAFYDTTTQSGSAGVAYSMKLNNTDISDGVIISGSGGIKVLAAGTYDLQFSAQVLADTGADTVWIWLKKNGTNVPDTSTKLVLRNNEADVAAWNFVVAANANDVFELAWQSNGGHTKLFAEAAASNYTAIPSVIATMNRVDVGGGTNLVSTSSFNAYTSSTNTRLTNIEATTASLLIETSNLETFSSSALISLSNLNTFTSSQNTLNGTFARTGSNSFVGNQTITGSLILSSSADVELQVIGNTIITGSLILSSSAPTELQVIGNSVFTGSAFGNVVSMSITSNTASMDLSLGNYFTLTLANTATTHISASNVQPGTSATLVITTGTNSSASLAPTMLQPSGSSYSATLGSAKKDVLSIVSVATGVPFVVSTKNMV
jgi:uncharacterized coiled-coil protein SlyX